MPFCVAFLLGVGLAKPSAHPPLPCLLGWESSVQKARGVPLASGGGGVVFGFLTSFPRAVGLSCRWGDSGALPTAPTRQGLAFSFFGTEEADGCFVFLSSRGDWIDTYVGGTRVGS